MKIFNLNKNIVIITILISVISNGVFYFGFLKNNRELIVYVDIGKVNGSPTLKPLIEIEEIENSQEAINKNIKIKARYLKDINTIQLIADYKKTQEFEAEKIIENITNKLVIKSTNIYNNAMIDQKIMYEKYLKLVETGKIFISNESLNKNFFEGGNNTLPKLEYSVNKNNSKISLFLGLFIALTIIYYIIISIIYDYKFKK
jgi:hypothetical protein